MTGTTIVAGTGHRLEKLGGYADTIWRRLNLVAGRWLEDNQGRISYMISGMALGWDQALANQCVELNIPFDAYIPFTGQDSRWPTDARKRYNDLIGRARSVLIVSQGGYAPYKMQKRNMAMVDAADMILALWNGNQTGGTYNCILYAEVKQKLIVNLWSRYLGQP